MLLIFISSCPFAGSSCLPCAIWGACGSQRHEIGCTMPLAAIHSAALWPCLLVVFAALRWVVRQLHPSGPVVQWPNGPMRLLPADNHPHLPNHNNRRNGRNDQSLPQIPILSFYSHQFLPFSQPPSSKSSAAARLSPLAQIG